MKEEYLAQTLFTIQVEIIISIQRVNLQMQLLCGHYFSTTLIEAKLTESQRIQSFRHINYEATREKEMPQDHQRCYLPLMPFVGL